MTRAHNISVQNNFIKGLISEATGLTFPENACTDTDNCIFKQTGLVSRRLGYDFESRNDVYEQDATGSVIASFVWRDVSDEGDLSFVVVQIGDTLHFYEVVPDAPLSAHKHATTIDLTDFAPSGVTSVKTIECQFASGNGKLFVTNQRLNTFYVSYDLDTNDFTATQINLQIRDFVGDTVDTLEDDTRPNSTLGTLTAAHRYNLQNQGWTATNLTAWDTARSDMPSNADVSWRYKSAAGAFDFTTVANKFFGNTKAPRGHYIYNIYNINRSLNFAGATDVTVDLNRVSTCAFYAGRVFYAGLKAKDLSSTIFFSQIIENDSQYGKCYQQNDPTAEDLFDLLSTDGGTIDLIEAGQILKMVPIRNALLVFATNGVWSITGAQGTGAFQANDYTITKISTVQNVSHTSFVIAEGVPFWWTVEGIYTIEINPQSQSFAVKSVTDGTIRNFYKDIPGQSKQFARGIYNPVTKIIQWIYRLEPATGFEDNYSFTGALNLNMLSGAFYPWSVSDDNVKINSLVNIVSLGGSFSEDTVTNSAVTVTDGGSAVIVFEASNADITANTKYFVSYEDSGTQHTFAENFKDTYLDWESYDDVGEEYESYFVTGYAVRGQGIRKFQSNYVNVVSQNEVDTSFKIIGQWNYAISGDSGRWTSSQTFNLTADSFAYKPLRIKIRGHGLACQFRIYNNSTYPFFIVGWSTFETGNQWV